jgi:hypothetical protein
VRPAVFCADPNPWDASILCHLLAGHHGLHEADGPIRWSSVCHFPGDDCRPAHPAAALRETA